MTSFTKLIPSLIFCTAVLAAQSIDSSLLLHPPRDSWPTYHGDYSGRRHSAITQITPANVYQMTLAWAFQTNQTQQIKASPIVVNGVIYITTPDNLWAIDARTARQLWKYTYPMNDGFHIGHRGAAVYKDSVFLTTPDAHLVALDARNGSLKWNVVIADSKRGYWSTNAPLLIRNHLLAGAAATSIICREFSGPSIPTPGKRNGPSTARCPQARLAPSVAALQAARCG
jgi:alcohol dehydrogenase (cytochrome c)